MKVKSCGCSVVRIDADAKVTGKALYGDDLRVTDMVYAKGVYAKHAHARLLGVHIDDALALPGVLDVITAKDFPGTLKVGEAVQDQYVLAADKVRFLGDVIAVVAAETPEIAAEAAKLVWADYEELPVYANAKDALAGEAIGDEFPDNKCVDVYVRKGELEAGFAEAEELVESHYETSWIEHAYIEPEVVLAIPGCMRQEVTIKGSIQNPYNVRVSVSNALALPIARVVIQPSVMGGTFGGKQETLEPMSARAGLLALRLCRPVKYTLTREESIIEGFKRHPVSFEMKMGAKRDGTLTALRGRALTDGGAYTNMTIGVMFKTVSLGAGPYRIPNVDYQATGAITNSTISGSMRGFGTPQAILAMENTLNEMAQRLGMSPLEIRRKNLLSNGDTAPNGQVLDFHEVSIRSVMEKAAEAIDFERKFEEYSRQTGPIRRGVGIACSMRGNSVGAEVSPDTSRTYIEVEQDGSVHVNIGLTEQGQGLHTALAQVAADALGVHFEHITMSDVDTAKAPSTGAAIASRGTLMGSAAICDAGETIKGIIAQGVAQQYQKPVDDIEFCECRVTFADMDISFEEAVAATYKSGLTPAATGTYTIPHLDWDEHAGRGEAFFTYTYSCHMAEVEVDTETGTVEIVKMVGSHDMGRALNPRNVEGQIYGGLVMAAGMAVMEDLGVDPVTTEIKHTNFEEYLIPTVMDTGEAVPILDENPDPRAKAGGRSIGEPATEPGAAAVLGAINMALGQAGLINTLPADIDKVFFACQALREEGKL